MVADFSSGLSVDLRAADYAGPLDSHLWHQGFDIAPQLGVRGRGELRECAGDVVCFDGFRQMIQSVFDRFAWRFDEPVVKQQRGRDADYGENSVEGTLRSRLEVHDARHR